MRISLFISAFAVAGFLVGCGGSSGGGKEDNRSSYEKLEAMEAELQAAVDKVIGPIDQVDTMITNFTEAPTKYKLSATDFKDFAASIFAGGALAVPAGLDAKAAEDLKGFATSFTAFKDGLMNAPDNAKALVGTLGTALATVPVLAGQVAAEATITQKNPFAKAEEKAAAKKQAEGVKALADRVKQKIGDIQKKVTELPGKAAGAIGKFTAAMAKAGITSLGAAKAAGSETVKDVKDGAKDVVSDSADAAKDAAKPATDAAAPAKAE